MKKTSPRKSPTPSAPSTVKRITANIDADLLARAQAVSGEGITETLTKGLELVCRQEALRLAEQLRGKIKLLPDGGRLHGRAHRR